MYNGRLFAVSIVVFLQKPLCRTSRRSPRRLVRRQRGLVLRGLGDGSDCVVRHRFVSSTPARIRCSPLPRACAICGWRQSSRALLSIPFPSTKSHPQTAAAAEQKNLGPVQQSAEAAWKILAAFAACEQEAATALEARGEKTAAASPGQSKRQRRGTGSWRRCRKVSESCRLPELPHELTEHSRGRTFALVCHELMIAPTSNLYLSFGSDA